MKLTTDSVRVAAPPPKIDYQALVEGVIRPYLKPNTSVKVGTLFHIVFIDVRDSPSSFSEENLNQAFDAAAKELAKFGCIERDRRVPLPSGMKEEVYSTISFLKPNDQLLWQAATQVARNMGDYMSREQKRLFRQVTYDFMKEQGIVLPKL